MILCTFICLVITALNLTTLAATGPLRMTTYPKTGHSRYPSWLRLRRTCSSSVCILLFYIINGTNVNSIGMYVGSGAANPYRYQRWGRTAHGDQGMS